MGSRSVYLIHAYASDGKHYMKVGVSNDPDYRLGTFKSVCPFAEIVFYFPGNQEIEYRMIQSLESGGYKKVHQEVFEVSEENLGRFVEDFLHLSNANGFSDPMNTEKYTGCKVSCYRKPVHMYFHKYCNPETCVSAKDSKFPQETNGVAFTAHESQ